MRNSISILGAGFIAGIWSGLLGLGGGALMVPMMVSFWSVQQHVATATSLAVILPTAIIGTILYQHQGNLDVVLATKVAIGSILGAYCGATLACHLPAATLKKSFGVAMILIGIRMVIG